MSYTEIFKFNKVGDAESVAEIRNAHRGAMSIWIILEEKYLPSLPQPTWANHVTDDRKYWSRTSSALFLEEGDHPMAPIWKLFDDDRMSRKEKIVLGSTFDNVIVLKKNLKELVEAFESFEGETSLIEQANELKKLLNEDIEAIGFNQTSVIGDTWTNKGGFDEETEEYLPYNILKEEGQHWELFKEIK